MVVGGVSMLAKVAYRWRRGIKYDTYIASAWPVSWPWFPCSEWEAVSSILPCIHSSSPGGGRSPLAEKLTRREVRNRQLIEALLVFSHGYTKVLCTVGHG